MKYKILSEKYEKKFEALLLKEKYLEVINSFSQSLILAESTEDIVWCVTDNAISKMGYQDCIVYLKDENKDELIQKSAFGPKASGQHEIKNPIIIARGRGIVGSVFKSGQGEIVNDVTLDSRYIQDNFLGGSEVTVPIILDGKVIGVIDSEHREKNFFSKIDFDILTTIASMISVKLEKVKASEKYKVELEEAVHNKTKELERTNKILKNQNREKEILIKEIHHRVKNNMQIIISLLNMHIKSATTDYEKHVFKECSDRMHAIANVHGKVYFDKNLLKINIKEFIFELSSELITSYYKKKKINLKLNIDVEEVSLDVAIPLGLIVNEMISITINNEFSCQQHEDVVIDMIESDGYYIVNYSDATNGYELDDTTGFFGIQLVDILKDQLEADLEITSDILTLKIPVN